MIQNKLLSTITHRKLQSLDYPSPDQISSQQVPIDDFASTNKESGFIEPDNGNSQVSLQDKPPEQHFMNMLANIVINFIMQDKNVYGNITSISNHSKEITQNDTEVSSLNLAISAAEGSDYYELLKEVPMTEEQLMRDSTIQWWKISYRNRG